MLAGCKLVFPFLVPDRCGLAGCLVAPYSPDRELGCGHGCGCGCAGEVVEIQINLLDFSSSSARRF